MITMIQDIEEILTDMRLEWKIIDTLCEKLL